jgi:putative aldouronate transport system substrate-binding protein
MNDLWDKYSHHWQLTFDQFASDVEADLITSNMYSPDGNMYGFPFYSSDPTDSQVECIYMNQVWLDTLGLEKPTTLDEFYNVLVAFRDEDPNGNGIADEIPLLGYDVVDMRSDFFFIFANSFLYYNYQSFGRFFINEEGKLDTGYTQEEYRESLRYVKKLYDENLLAPFSLTQDFTQFKALIDLPDGEITKVGALAHHPWSGREGWTYNAEGFSKVLEYTALAPLKGPDGVAWSPYTNTGMRFNVFITRDCENPEAAFRLLDYACDPHVSIVSRRGEEGVDWEYVDPSTPGRYEVLGFDTRYRVMMDAWAQTEQNSIYNLEFHFLPARAFASVAATDFDTDVARRREEIFMEGLADRLGNYPDEIVMYLVYTEEELNEINQIITDINTYTDEARVLFATGGLDLDADWDDYLAEIDAMGRQKWLDAAQAAYDRMKAK